MTWIGTEDGFLNRIGPDGSITDYGAAAGLPKGLNIHALVCRGTMLYVATYNDGIFVIDTVKGRTVRNAYIENVHLISMLECSDGQIIVGTNRGMYTYDCSSNTFTRHDNTNNTMFVHALCQDRTGRIIIGTFGRGVWIWDRSSSGMYKMTVAQGSEDLANAYVTSLYEDRSGTLWISTEGSGLFYARELSGSPGQWSAGRITRRDGLPSDITCAFAQSRDSRLWVSTDNGLACISPDSGKVDFVYTDGDGPIGNYYRYSAAAILPDGQIAMGTTLGVLTFRPEDLIQRQLPELYISDISSASSDSSLALREEGRSPVTSRRISVRGRDASSIRIWFAVPSNDGTRPLTYKYTLADKSGTLSAETTDNFVTFAGIQPGKYHFTVQLAGASRGCSLDINVIPSFFSSVWARALYIAVLLGVLAWIVMLYSARRLRSRRQILKDMEEQKQKEISDAKISFFTNIAHEIRTPLTLIKMPVDRILEDGSCGKAREDILTVKANTDRLLELTDQMLDLRKVESGKMRLDFLIADVCDILRKSCACFSAAARTDGITIWQTIPGEPIMLRCAPESLDKIFNNLLSNAIKYCKSEICICLEESGQEVLVSVSNDGSPIPADKAGKIFEPFYQEPSSKLRITGSKGTGLGLPFARMLAELHSGTLTLDTGFSEGCRFVLTLPKASEPERIAAEEEEPAADSNTERGRSVILIAEDDRQLNDYIRKALSQEYEVLQALDGEEALDIIKARKVDLVISDIMMPRMDGCELCDRIKSNIEYSHIPVLILTAAAGMETRLASLKAGADGYIEKPFSLDLLKANVSNLFKNRDISFRQFTDSPLSHFKGAVIGSMDDEFMTRLHSEVMGNLADSSLGVESLSQAMNTSKSTLLRKVKANTGLNVSEYIKLCRLKKAAELLAERKYRIGEVVWLVGFSSASYFAASFKKQFNISPSDFVKKLNSGISDK